jgi:hypothetical protein
MEIQNMFALVLKSPVFVNSSLAPIALSISSSQSAFSSWPCCTDIGRFVAEKGHGAFVNVLDQAKQSGATEIAVFDK